MPILIALICLFCPVHLPLDPQLAQMQRNVKQIKLNLYQALARIQAQYDRDLAIIQANRNSENEILRQITTQAKLVAATQDPCEKKKAKTELNKLIDEYKALIKRNEADSEKK